MGTTTEPHRHVTLLVHVLVQRGGVPYEIEQEICAECRQVLRERRVRRADG
jgi:hypothetical protein